MRSKTLLISCTALLTSLLEAGPVSSHQDLNAEIALANSGLLVGDIAFTNDIDFRSGGRVALINADHLLTPTSMSYTIDGMHFTLSDSNAPGRRLLFSRGGGGTIKIQHLNLSGGRAKGGDGSGGGLGAGGGLFVQAGATVELDNVSFSDCSAIGGRGSAVSRTGGGGLGGNGGTATTAGSSGAGGGGFDGNGGNSSSPRLSSGGGGGGVGDHEGLHGHGEESTSSLLAGAGAGAGGAGGRAARADGGHGHDGSHGNDGGGGGGGGRSLANFAAGKGGAGGFGGGGGSGGEATTTEQVGLGGNGGFGGGGGWGRKGGTGGFGAGGGRGATKGGIAGCGGAPNGGGGAGFGGAIFIENTAELVIKRRISFSSNTVTGGTGPGGIGLARGADIFMMSSSKLTVRDLTSNSTVPSPIESDIGEGPGSVNVGGLFLDTGNTATLTLTGSNTYTGTTEISSGKLYINGSVITPVTVNENGTFGGNATLLKSSVENSGDLIINGGRVKPGGDSNFGSISVDNDVFFASASTFSNAKIDSINNTDSISAGGQAHLDGSLSVDIAEGNFLKGQLITLLTADRGVLGTFASESVPTRNGAPLFQVLYTPNAVQLLALQNSLFAGKDIQPGNPTHVADAIECLPNIDPNTEFGFAVQVLGLLDDADLNRALNTLHPGAFGTFEWINLTNNAHVTSIFGRQSNILCCSPRDCWGGGNFWIQPFGIRNLQDRISQLRGFRSSSGGVAAGYDVWCNCAIYGLGAGYTYTDFKWKDKAGKGIINQYYGGAYASWLVPCFDIDASVLVGGNQYKTRRRISYSAEPQHPGSTVRETAKSKYWGFQATGHLGFTTDTFRLGTRIPMQLFASGDYFYLKQDQFKESRADGLNLRVKKRDSHMVRTELGGLFSHIFYDGCNCYEPYARLSWVAKIPLNKGRLTSKFVDQDVTFDVNTSTRSFHQVAPEIGFKLSDSYGASFAADIRAEIGRHSRVYFADLRIEFAN